jgi:hypothetical protein
MLGFTRTATPIILTPEVCEQLRRHVRGRSVPKRLGERAEIVLRAAEAPPADYVHQQGWVLTAFRNALWQLLHASNLEEAVVDTVMRGGDTDTNAAICGALLGAVSGRDAVPGQWVDSLLKCRPAGGEPNVRHPRPECFWPVDALELAERLLKSGEAR